ncbi:hypothetical protein CG51_14280 [Haematobacter missouriensis]|nr:hypothetical protein CG51_14280 [Haematobacter missouriensis]
MRPLTRACSKDQLRFPSKGAFRRSALSGNGFSEESAFWRSRLDKRPRNSTLTFRCAPALRKTRTQFRSRRAFTPAPPAGYGPVRIFHRGSAARPSLLRKEQPSRRRETAPADGRPLRLPAAASALNAQGEVFGSGTVGPARHHHHADGTILALHRIALPRAGDALDRLLAQPVRHLSIPENGVDDCRAFVITGHAGHGGRPE